MSPVTIYESDQPAPFLPQISVFDYLLPPVPGVSCLPEYSPDLAAFIDGQDGRVLSRGALRDSAVRLAGGLRSLGLKRGDCAAIWGYNSLEWVVSAYACLAAGVVVSPANYGYAPAELAHQINDSGSALAFIDPVLLPEFEKARAHLKHKFPASRVLLTCKPENKPKGCPYRAIGEVFGKAIEPEHFDGADAESTAWMSYSSGTTGLPKGVMTTHYNITSQLQAANVSYTLEGGPNGDVVIGFLPMSHIYGVTLSLFQPLSFGSHVIVLPRFEEIQVLEAIQKYRVTHALLVPPLILRFIHSTNVAKYDISSLRSAMSGGAPLSPELATTFENRFPGCITIQGYGMTETTPNICTMRREEAKGRAGWVGKLIPTYQARLIRDDGTDAPVGEAGEMWVRSPSVMKGYHNNRQATVATMALGGWFKTGDVLVRDDQGWFKVVDRVKELIKFKGFQVAPAELEALLLTHPKVIDAGVVGVYDEVQVTELPRAYIVAAEGHVKDQAAGVKFGEEVKAWVAERVAKHKRLAGGVAVVDIVPKSPSGKILRKDLRKRAQEEFDAQPKKARL